MKKTRTKILLFIIFIEIIIMAGLFLRLNPFQLKSEFKLSIDPHKIVFSFNQPIIKNSFENDFQILPETQGEFIWADFNRQVTFKPQYLSYGLEYVASIKNIHSFIFTELKEKNIRFKIEPPSSINMANIAPNKLPLAEKNIFTKPNGEIITLSQPHFTRTKYIDIDISDQIMVTYENKQIKGIYEISTGRYDMPTPLGQFKIFSKEENHWSTQYSLWMPFSLQFKPGFYIHELPYWPNGWREGEKHLGTRVSHGCIRLGIGPAKEVYNFADLETIVMIHE